MAASATQGGHKNSRSRLTLQTPWRRGVKAAQRMTN